LLVKRSCDPAEYSQQYCHAASDYNISALL
jgi:hypothetical protein